MPVRRSVFTGEICGFGTTSGDRFVVGRWIDSPLGAFTDVMHEAADGTRTLFAPNVEVADFVQTTYTFDVVEIATVGAARSSTSLSVRSARLDLAIEIGRRSAIGWVLRTVPKPLATSPAWCRAIDPVARVVMRGVRTRGTAGNDRIESYGATDARRLSSIRASLDDVDRGALADVWPPVRFGFGSTPRVPSIVAVATTIDEVAR